MRLKVYIVTEDDQNFPDDGFRALAAKDIFEASAFGKQIGYGSDAQEIAGAFYDTPYETGPVELGLTE